MEQIHVDVDARDYMVEMRDLLNDLLASEDEYTPRELASALVEKLMAEDPDLLYGWLDNQAVTLVRGVIERQAASNRAYARQRAKNSVFVNALAAAEDGDEKPLRGFLRTRFTVENGTYKRLVDLTAKDLRFVEQGYRARASENTLNAVFLRELADRVGRRTVGDVFNEQELTKLWQSICKLS